MITLLAVLRAGTPHLVRLNSFMENKMTGEKGEKTADFLTPATNISDG